MSPDGYVNNKPSIRKFIVAGLTPAISSVRTMVMVDPAEAKPLLAGG